MSYQEFISQVIKELKPRVPAGSDIRVHKVTKNNNLQLDGLTIMKPGANISPTFYLNYYYDDYMEHKDISKIIELILSIYEEHQDPPHIDAEFFTDFEAIKDKIVYRIINFSMNRELLKEVPHIPYLDLAIVFYCLVRNDHFPNATILIRNSHLDFWKISDKELYTIAIQNTPKLLPPSISSIKDLLKDFHSIHHEDEIFPIDDVVDDELGCPNMFVLSNDDKMFGAACILYLNLFDKISEAFDSSFYVLPSSIHEVILVPSSNCNLIDHYSEMVLSVNQAHVLDEDILSDHAYFYSREQKALIH